MVLVQWIALVGGLEHVLFSHILGNSSILTPPLLNHQLVQSQRHFWGRPYMFLARCVLASHVRCFCCVVSNVLTVFDIPGWCWLYTTPIKLKKHQQHTLQTTKTKHNYNIWYWNWTYLDMRISRNGGTLIAVWFIRGNPSLKWMMTGGTPMTWEIPI